MTTTTTQTLTELLPKWEAHLAKNASPRTVEAYVPAVASFLVAMPASGMTMDAVEAWVDGLGGAPASRAQAISAVKSFLRYARDKGVLEQLPETMLKRPKVVVTSGDHYLEIDELRALIAGARTLSDRHYAAVYCLASTGLRVSELARARWADLRHDPSGELLGLRVVFGKGGKQRTVPIRPDLFEALAQLHGGADLDASDMRPLLPSRPDKHGRGNAYTRQAIERFVREAAAAAGPALHGKRPTAHWLRHSALTQASRDPSVTVWSIQQAAGHASPVTSALYCHASNELAQSALNHIPALV